MDFAFDLVMLAERMDESLVLLADLLCLPLHRVAMPIRSNARRSPEQVHNYYSRYSQQK